MNDKAQKEYEISIDPRILELLGPSLYTNIYYVLAELIANSYDANAHNVYVLEKDNEIIVEDDGSGMSYDDGDIGIYLNVAAETRTSEKDVFVDGSKKKRRKIGRKGIGKLAALSVSEKVLVKTIKNGEKSGFIMSRQVGSDRKLKALEPNEIVFENKTIKNGTSIVMTNPEYGMHKTAKPIKDNLLKIFPMINKDFQIHIKTKNSEVTIDNFDAEIIQGLGALIIIGNEFYHLSKHFSSGLEDHKKFEKDLLKKRESFKIPLKLKTREDLIRDYNLEIKGWIGAYRTTRDRKLDRNDFPDNFISLLSHKKLGEYNILPLVGKNRLPEVYIVGQLHVDLFEATELPDMALSNRQGYKSDDPRYVAVRKYVSDELLPEIVSMRVLWANHNNKKKKKEKEEKKKKLEEELRMKVEQFKTRASKQVAKKIRGQLDNQSKIRETVKNEMNALLPIVGLKRKVDEQKKRILISHTGADKLLSDTICKMLVYNGVPLEDILYTSSDSEECRIPEGVEVFNYLRDFFVDSISSEKIYVIYVTSNNMEKSWYAVTEVGAGWITKSAHKVFNIQDHTPKKPLNTDVEWQTSSLTGGTISMRPKEFDKFIVKILDICQKLGYSHKTKKENEKELMRYVSKS